MDFVGGYHSKSVNDLINLFGERRTVRELLMDCQKWFGPKIVRQLKSFITLKLQMHN